MLPPLLGEQLAAGLATEHESFALFKLTIGLPPNANVEALRPCGIPVAADMPALMALAGVGYIKGFLKDVGTIEESKEAMRILLDAGIDRAGQPYLALEYVDGEAITAYCQSRQLGIPARLDLFRQVCEAVSHAHANLIVHRDLKPANVMVGEFGEVLVAD